MKAKVETKAKKEKEKKNKSEVKIKKHKQGQKGTSHIYKKHLLEALESCMGIVTLACKKISISRRTHYEYMETDEDYKKQVYDIQEMVLDLAESKLIGFINQGSETSTMFYLKTKGRNRGYSQDIILQQKEEKEIKVNIQVVDDKKK